MPGSAVAGGHYVARIYDPQACPWQSIAHQIMEIEREGFGRGAFSKQYLKWAFLEPTSTAGLLIGDDDRIGGFTVAAGMGGIAANRRERETAYIVDTVIRRELRGRALVGLLMQMVERELKERGFRFLERHAAIANGYADSIRRHYGPRIIREAGPQPSEWGEQMFFRIRL